MSAPWRRTIKSTVARSLHALGLAEAIGAVSRRRYRPLVLCYHRVVQRMQSEAHAMPAMQITQDMLARQLRWVGRSHRFVALDELAAAHQGADQAGAAPVAAVTFDDGYRDVAEHGLPVLRALGVPATVFVVTDLAGGAGIPLHDRLYRLLHTAAARWGKGGCLSLAALRELGVSPEVLLGAVPAGSGSAATLTELLCARVTCAALGELVAALESAVGVDESDLDELRILDWPAIRALDRAGVTIGSHTQTHIILPLESRARVRRELAESRQELAAELGHGVDCFAYPAGRFSAADVEAVAAAGYAHACTTCRHRHAAFPQLTVPRKHLWENCCKGADGQFSGAVMSAQINGIFEVLRACSDRHAERPADLDQAPVRQDPLPCLPPLAAGGAATQSLTMTSSTDSAGLAESRPLAETTHAVLRRTELWTR
ncbi:MAG: polysaccharide deacetylase family protein [Candidatus Schekmanbacteria bacterium]|nr:polysaccharide deacetylase family protein [Candidatus Schekmanbacteria bacterium]